ncbi:MAG: type II secretion system F family protein, partial [Myxococcales bacterium]|nr:type II secretion system F family protein [Myxococcales bacterium]
MATESSDPQNLLSSLSTEDQQALLEMLQQQQKAAKSDTPPIRPASGAVAAARPRRVYATGDQKAAESGKSLKGKVKDFLEMSRGVNITGSVTRSDLADVLRQFKFLHESGCEMLRTLEILSNTQNPVLAKMFAGIRQDVEAGVSLADAFAKHERRVGNVVVSTIRAAEESGTLAESLDFLADNISKDDEVRRNIRKALTYPVVTGTVTMTVFIACLILVVPQFESLYTSSMLGDDPNLKPTGLTAVVFSLSHFLRHDWFLWVPLLGLIVGGIVYFLRSNPIFLDRMMLKIPLLNKLLVISDLSRFCDRLGLLLGSGVPILKAVTLAKETVANRVLRPIFARMATQAERGQALSEAFA